jgi:hypothetical protein
MHSSVKRILCVLTSVATVCMVAGAFQAVSGQNHFASASQPATAEALSATALELTIVPTINCIGVQWDLRGDSNANATGALEYRGAGSGVWQRAFPLRRSPFRLKPSVKSGGGLERWSKGMREYALGRYRQNYLAGSIFGLTPATKYEVRVTLSDPDGGGTSQTRTVSTRVVPTIPKGGRIIEVRGGGDALKKAAEAAQPGDVLRVHAGTYAGGFIVSAKGTAERPVCITAAGDGEVLLHGGDAKKNDVMGIRVSGTFVRLEGLSFYNFFNCIRTERAASNLAVMRCKMNHFHTAIYSRADDGYFADNSIRESYNPLDETVVPEERNEGHGIELRPETSGNVACYNEISLVADGIRLWGRDSDVYGNDVIFNIDDGIELDGGGTNLRVMDNVWSFTGQNGLSFQPYIGGPAFMVRNLVIGAKESSIKNRYESDGAVFINNTLICYDGRASDLPYGSYTRNNLFLTTPGEGRRSAQVDISNERVGRLDMDYDGFGPKGPNGLPVSEFSTRTGLEKHGIQFASNGEVLANSPGAFPEYQSKQWTVPDAFLKEKGRPHPDLTLKPGSPAIGAGVAIPNITERADRRAPDLGALQFGQPAPHYGPRRAL